MTLGSKEWHEGRQRARDAYPAELAAYPEWRALNALVQSPATASAADAVQQVLDLTPTPAASSKTPLGNHAYHLVLSLIEIAKRTPPENQGQARLVDFVARLQKHVRKDPATGEPLKHNGYAVWTQLPALGYVAADVWGSVDPLNPTTAPDELQHYEHFIALLAQLSAAATVDYSDPVVPEMDFSFWSMRAFKDAFESPEQTTDAARRVASRWLIYAADRLWANIQHGRVFGRKGDETVLTREMWEGWKRGLVAAKEASGDEGTGRLVGEALGRMEEVEGK